MKVKLSEMGSIPEDLLEETVDLETIIVLNNRMVWKNRISQNFRR
jgi:hypothetical protein